MTAIIIITLVRSAFLAGWLQCSCGGEGRNRLMARTDWERGPPHPETSAETERCSRRPMWTKKIKTKRSRTLETHNSVLWDSDFQFYSENVNLKMCPETLETHNSVLWGISFLFVICFLLCKMKIKISSETLEPPNSVLWDGDIYRSNQKCAGKHWKQ